MCFFWINLWAEGYHVFVSFYALPVHLYVGVLQFFRHRGCKDSDNFMVAMFPTVFSLVSNFPTLLKLRIGATKKDKSIKKLDYL